VSALSIDFQQILSNTTQIDKELLLEAVKSRVLKMQFLNRLQEECMNKEEDLANQF